MDEAPLSVPLPPPPPAPFILPPGLTRIGICAPASPPAETETVGLVIERLTGLGFQVIASEHIEERTGYLAGSDQQRADDLHSLFTNPQVQAIFALRGGYGSCRLLPYLDYDLIRANPKPFIGFSDITALHNAIYARSGLITYHGPNAGQAFDPPESPWSNALVDVVTGTNQRELIGPGSWFPDVPVEAWVEGIIQGKLLGGNFTCLERLLGTPYQPDFQGCILFLEDIQEKAYRLDGLFTHFRLAGVLDQIAGLVLGHFTYKDEGEPERIQETLRREAEQIGVPCLAMAQIGHGIDQITVPVGAEALLYTSNKTLSLVAS